MTQQVAVGVNQLYGQTNNPLEPHGFHSGIDLALNTVNLYSTQPGMITSVENSNSGYGNTIIEKFASGPLAGFSERWAHLSKINVRQYDVIQPNTLLGVSGASGNTGNPPGPHLHLELINPQGQTVDPTGYIPQLLEFSGGTNFAGGDLHKSVAGNLFSGTSTAVVGNPGDALNNVAPKIAGAAHVITDIPGAIMSFADTIKKISVSIGVAGLGFGLIILGLYLGSKTVRDTANSGVKAAIK